MPAYVLIMTLVAHGYVTGGSTTTTEFSRKEACEAAATRWKSAVKASNTFGYSVDDNSIIALCVPKDRS